MRKRETRWARGREGESFAVSLEIVRLDLPDGHPKKKRWTTAVPSPGGEGQDEGGSKCSLILRPAFAHYSPAVPRALRVRHPADGEKILNEQIARKLA